MEKEEEIEGQKYVNVESVLNAATNKYEFKKRYVIQIRLWGRQRSVLTGKKNTADSYS